MKQTSVAVVISTTFDGVVGEENVDSGGVVEAKMSTMTTVASVAVMSKAVIVLMSTTFNRAVGEGVDVDEVDGIDGNEEEF